MSKQFHFKQFSLALVRSLNEVCSLNVKTDLFQAIQFSISTQFSSIWPIDRALSGPTTLKLFEIELFWHLTVCKQKQ